MTFVVEKLLLRSSGSVSGCFSCFGPTWSQQMCPSWLFRNNIEFDWPNSKAASFLDHLLNIIGRNENYSCWDLFLCITFAAKSRFVLFSWQFVTVCFTVHKKMMRHMQQQNNRLFSPVDSCGCIRRAQVQACLLQLFSLSDCGPGTVC